MKSLAEQIVIMQAALDGSTIERNGAGPGMDEGWRLCQGGGDPLFDWVRFDYRIKPEPKQWWLVMRANDTVADAMDTAQKAADFLDTCHGPHGAAISDKYKPYRIVHVREVEAAPAQRDEYVA